MEDCIDISTLGCKNISVAVDGKMLPMKIGDRISIDGTDQTIRTVTCVQISSTGLVTYCLEWFDGNEFKSEWLTTSELWHVWKSTIKKNVQGFGS